MFSPTRHTTLRFFSSYNQKIKALKKSMLSSADGITLQVSDTGEQQKLPILFIHGWRQSSSCWHYQLTDATLQQKHRLLAFDLRGHGASSKPTDETYYQSPTLWAADIHAVITARDLQKPIICAWSSGALFLCDYIRQFGSEHLGGIVWVSPHIRGYQRAKPTHTPIDYQMYMDMNAKDEQIKAKAVKQFISHLFHGEKNLPTGKLYDALWQDNFYVSDLAAIGMYHRGSDYHCDDVLSTLKCPSLMLAGGHDAFIALDDFHEQAALMGSRCLIDDNAGHTPFIEAPQLFNTHLLQFSQRVIEPDEHRRFECA